MSASIGSALSSFADLAVQRVLGKAGVGSTSGKFADHLAGAKAARTMTSDPQSADALWLRAQALSFAAGNGPGDAMMRAISDAADARAERRHGRGGGLFDI